MRSLTEKIIILSKKTLKLEGKETDLTPDEFKKWTKNCWFIPTNNEKQHPAIFPEELPKRIIKLYSWVNNIVLDPFAGIGTTCIIAKKLKRNYIGIDMSKKYCEIAKQRLSMVAGLRNYV